MNLAPATRKRIYETSIAAVAVAVVYGLLDGQQAAAWLVLIAAVLGMARANVPPSPPKPRYYRYKERGAIDVGTAVVIGILVLLVLVVAGVVR